MSRHVPRALRARLRYRAFLGLVLVSLAGCSGASEEDNYVELPVEDLYNAAQDSLQAGRYREAARTFEDVDRQHPYSTWATQAQLMTAYAYYENDNYDEAISAAERFIQLHPGSPDAAYAYYLRGISYYERISDVGRDQAMTNQALSAFNDLISRYPDSTYARDAQLKVDLANDHLAGKEMEIGRYYLDRSEPIAAVNRFQRVVDSYQTTTHVPEALHRLTEAYLMLGMVDEAEQSAAVLGYNYPGSEWYQDSYQLLADNGLVMPGQPELAADEGS
ncbi:outer membrane protein assembly factor BamD [Marinivivus vitaminiproducens]|uniref:outer membrane protein assembly factor BamD n=1 Tax=Marinivivus vitaminiproducens TaxID=3035935 RepID=UPI00279FEA54|nr:outer membrane protein assembly factor BamD [Geminicoccaceae bacterium SCSIO 64248]